MATGPISAGSGQPCSVLAILAPDVREIVCPECPRCQGTGPDCLAERLWELAAEDQPPSHPDGAPSGPGDA